MKGKRLFKIFFVSFAALCFLAAFMSASLFLFHDLLGFTTSNSAIYIVKDFDNGIEIRKDLCVGEGHKLLFMLDASRLFNAYMREFARFAGRPMGSSKIKDTYDEVILESVHELERQGKKVIMTRRAHLKAADDHLTMGVTLKNPNDEPLAFSYVYADEPWVGNFGSSAGDVGWLEEGIIQFTGYANFMEWNSRLKPGESITYKFAVGMAGKINGFPSAPLINAHS